MSFSAGQFDLNIQVEQPALDALALGILKELKSQARASFQQSIGSQINIKATLTALKIFGIQPVNPADRFAGTLASFGVRVRLEVSSGASGTTSDAVEIDFKGLQVELSTSPGGLPTGIALGFKKIDLEVRGLGIFTGIINTLLDWVALGIRSALVPLGLTPIPVYQMTDVFAKLGIAFAPDSPVIASSLGRNGLVALTDFARAGGNPSDRAAVTDLLPANGALTVAGQFDQEFAKQIITIGFAKGYFPASFAAAGLVFHLTRFEIQFLDPAPGYRAKIKALAVAGAKIKVGKCKFLGWSFGKKKNITAEGVVRVDSDGVIAQRPSGGAELIFKFEATVAAKVSVPDIYAVALSIVLGPLIFLLLLGLAQLVNIAADLVLPLTVAEISRDGIDLKVTLKKLQTGVGIFSISAKAEVGGTGIIDLDQIVSLRLQKFPVKLQFTADSLASRNNELFLAASLRTP